MKTIIIINFIIILSYNTCQKEFVPFNETIELNYKVTKTFDDSNLKICFDSVADSRCPTDVVCVWAGNAAVSFIFTDANKETRFVLNTYQGFRTDTLISGYRIKLVDVNPLPRLNPPNNPEDYKAEVLITNK
jgi:hypothetical protein